MNKDEINDIAQKLEDYIERIETSPHRENGRKGLYGYTEYLNRKAHGSQSRGIRRANIIIISTYFTNLRIAWSKDPRPIPNTGERKKYGSHKSTVERFFFWAQQYLDYLKDIYLEGQTFYLYYLHIDRYYREPQLGRALLTILKKQEAQLINLPMRRDYRGTVRITQDRFVFELKTEREEQLHIKVKVFDREKQEIFLGSYITFAEEHIITGSLILEKCRKSDPQPAAISWHSTPNRLDEVSTAIKNYLSIRKLNYHRTPNRVVNITQLSKFVEKDEETWSERFLEADLPILFIAGPTKSVKKVVFKNRQSYIQWIVTQLQSRFKGVFDIRNVDKHISILEGNSHLSSTAFRVIQRTRIFVLVLTKTEKHTFSLVQLGWAIAHCKYIVICYEKGCISENINSLIKLNRPSHNRIKMSRFNDLETDYEEIYEQIQNAIIENINHFFDSDTQ